MRARRFAPEITSVVLVASAVAWGGCRKTSEEQRREAERATIEAEQKASETTITSATLDEDANAEARDAADTALREQAEAITATRDEQVAYRGKLQRALDDLDAKRRVAKRRGQTELKVIDARRALLKQRLDALDRTTDADWAALKAKIDRDLRDVAGDRDREGK